MTNKAGDPIAFWQQMVGEMQKSFTAFTRLRPMGAASRPSDDPATSGNGQKPMADLMENYFAGMNVPSRGQLTALNERLTSIEGELAETRALLKELLAAKVAPPTPAADLTPKLNEIKSLLDALVAASKVPPPAAPTPVDVSPKLNEIKGLLEALVAASKAPHPEPLPQVDVTPQLSEIKALLDQILKSEHTPDPAPIAAIQAELREIRDALDAVAKSSPPGEPEPSAVEAAPKAAEPARHGKRNKKHGGMPDRGPGPRQDVPSGS
ncbi:conserved hypothetical protein [Bradyrhizobium sp. ORS 375]|uniref:hypothetical protein n=1 Tax=Bradyrhizobium sp. (strain ORS 375) TaxID=566679 RepID=UPI00024062B2|nr:hypothetical protein [Bradyrhizobium sp. ORS 375]CCD90673.1 conserved hypothetical protein [Bradyrhizobium sp. ORS 375]